MTPSAPTRLVEAADSLAKASSPEPFSRSKTSNWVARSGGLPPYIQHIAHDLMEKRGKSESNAIQMAIGIVKNWASGKGKVDSGTRAAASKAVAEWEAKKGANAAKGAARKVSESRQETRGPSLADRVALRQAAAARLRAIEESFGVQMMSTLLEAAGSPAAWSPELKRTASGSSEIERHEVHDGGQHVGYVTARPGYGMGAARGTRYAAKAVNGRMVGETMDSKAKALDCLKKHLEEAPARVSAHKGGRFLVANPDSYSGPTTMTEFPSQSSARYAAGLPEAPTSVEQKAKVVALGEMAAFDAATLGLLGEELPGQLGQLAEGFASVFDEAKHPRGAHGKFSISSLKIGHVIEFSHKSPRGSLQGRITGKGRGHVMVRPTQGNSREMRVAHERIRAVKTSDSAFGGRFAPVAQPGAAARTRAEIIRKSPGAEREAQSYRSTLKAGAKKPATPP